MPSRAYGHFIGDLLASAFADLETAALETFIFRIGRVATADAALTPLSSKKCSDASAGLVCECSKGISEFHVLPLYAMGNASASGPLFDYAHSGCGVTYVPLSSAAALSTVALVGIAAGAVLVAIVAAVAGVFVIILCCVVPATVASKRIRNAPTDTTQPFAIAFTDIQASTQLWAHAPQHMGAALDSHHAIVRELVAKHNGYEVKTIGDSFMVAFKEAKAAVDFACAVQQALFDHSWGTDVLDETYRDLALDDGIQEAPGTGLWHGLRVRVAIHHGVGDIKFDEATQGYDFYGTVVNTAARVEAVGHGGQVIITGDCLAALRAAGTASAHQVAAHHGVLPNTGTDDFLTTAHGAAVVTDLGPQPLRGLDDDVPLYQVVPVAFAKRRFPPLRLSKESRVDAFLDAGSDVSSGSSSLASARGRPDRKQGPPRPRGEESDDRLEETLHSDTHPHDGSSDPILSSARRAARTLRLRTPPSGVYFAFRLIHSLHSTMAPKQRWAAAADLAAKWAPYDRRPETKASDAPDATAAVRLCDDSRTNSDDAIRTRTAGPAAAARVW